MFVAYISNINQSKRYPVNKKFRSHFRLSASCDANWLIERLLDMPQLGLTGKAWGYSFSMGRSDLDTSGRISFARRRQLEIALDIAHQLSPWRGSACTHRCITFSCWAWGERGGDSLLYVGRHCLEKTTNWTNESIFIALHNDISRAPDGLQLQQSYDEGLAKVPFSAR